MKIFSGFIAITFAILAFSFTDVNAQSFSDGKSAKPIEQRIKSKILGLPNYEVFDHIGFSLNGGTVTLSGKVRNAINRSSAKKVVERIDGVTSVVNNIEVLPLGSYDESIRANLYRRLSNTGGLSRYLWPTNPSVRLVVDRGRVSLEGYVSNRGDYNTMNILANGVFGVFSVDNNLVIDNGRSR